MDISKHNNQKGIEANLDKELTMKVEENVKEVDVEEGVMEDSELDTNEIEKRQQGGKIDKKATLDYLFSLS